MLSSWVTQQHVRFILGGITFVSGSLLARLLANQSSLAIGIFTIVLAALVGMGKQASP